MSRHKIAPIIKRDYMGLPIVDKAVTQIVEEVIGETVPKDVIQCECGFVFDTERGLALHKRMWCKKDT